MADVLKKRIRLFPDPTNILSDSHASPSVLDYTATEDCYINIWKNGTANSTVKLNNVEIAETAQFKPSGVSWASYGFALSFFLKTGDVVTSGTTTLRYIVMGLR